MTSLASQYEVDGVVTLGRLEQGMLDIRGNPSVQQQPSNSDQKRQKFIVGDRSGGITCSLLGKDDDVEELWKTRGGIDAISRVCLGGLKKTKDQIYVLCENAISAYKKAGANFFRFPDPVEGIVSFFVHETQIVCFTSNTVHVFEQTTKIGSYSCGAEILCSSIGPVIDGKATILVSTVTGNLLWLQTKVKEEVSVLARIDLEAPASCISCEHDDQVLLGLKNGKIVLYTVEEQKQTQRWNQYVTAAGSVVRGQSCVAANGDTHVIHSEITSIGYSAMLKVVNGKKCLELLIGTYDGTLSLLLLDIETLAITGVAYECWTKDTVIYAKSGYVTSDKYMDILVVYKSGRMSCFSSGMQGNIQSLLTIEDKGLKDRLQNLGSEGSSLTQVEIDRVTEHSVNSQRSKVAELRGKIDHQKEKQRKLGTRGTKPVSLSQDVFPKPQSNQFRLVLTSELPLEVVTVRSSKKVLVELVDTQQAVQSDQTAENVTVDRDLLELPDTPSQGHQGSSNLYGVHSANTGSLLNFRCAGGIYKMELSATLYEGEPCSIQAYCLLTGATVRCQVVSNELKPLCLHKAMSVVDANTILGQHSYARISIAGEGILIPTVYHWLERIFYGVVTDSKEHTELHELAFQNRVDNTVVLISFVPGKQNVHTENITTAKTLRKVLVGFMNEARMKIQLNISLKEEAVLANLTKLQSLFYDAFEVPQKILLQGALLEIQTHEQDMKDYFDATLVSVLNTHFEAPKDVTDVPLLCENAMALFDSIYELKGKIINLKLREKLHKT